MPQGQDRPEADVRHVEGQNDSAWAPGLGSRIPSRLNNRITLFAAENSRISHDEAREAATFCGLEIIRLIDLTAERMVVHELLVRVTADLSVPDGPSYEYLGLSLRGMVETLHRKHLAPQMEALTAAYENLRENAAARMQAILTGQAADADHDDRTFWQKLTGRQKPRQHGAGRAHSDVEARIQSWREKSETSTDPIDRACYMALAELGLAMVTHRGRLGSDHDALVGLALRLFCNHYGPVFIRQLVDPHFSAGAVAEGYRFLPAQDKRIIMNTKGASAAGKSTIRPHQRRLAESLGIRWEDFALISPDYWRKYLLDYDSLGADYKYAGMLSGQELSIVDQKLDRYMSEKADRGDVPHLLIDRFRFDSFLIDSDGGLQSTLLTRFGDTVFMFFVITPPHETVERAWRRGLTTQRYKAVDDLLYHNIEAYTGIPELFFAWTATTDKTVHFEFLDNDVPLGEDPKTIAYGCNNAMTVLDPVCLSRIDHYREVNIEASCPEDVLDPTYVYDYSFLRRCLVTIPHINFADPETGAVYGGYRDGSWDHVDPAARPPSLAGEDRLIQAIDLAGKPASGVSRQIDLKEASRFTLGRWGAKI